MKKHSVAKQTLFSTQNKKIALLVVIGVLVLTIVSSIGQKPNINLIEESVPVTLEGAIFKDTPSGIAGNYYLTNLGGGIVMLQTSENLDGLEGTLVRVHGSIIPASDPQTLSTTKIEVLSSQQ